MSGLFARPTVLDIGAGNCRDSKYFAEQGGVVTAADPYGIPPENPPFIFTNKFLSDLPDIKCDCVYSRFFLHAVEEEIEDYFLSYVAQNAKHLFFEARSDLGVEEVEYYHGDHYRRPINANKIFKKLSARGFTTIEFYEKRGLAEYKGEDPCVIRVWARV